MLTEEIPFALDYEEVLEDYSAEPEVYGYPVCIDPWDPSLGPVEPTEEQNRVCEATSEDWEDFWRAGITLKSSWDSDDSWMLDDTKSN